MILHFLLLLVVGNSALARQEFPCLPGGLKPRDVVSAERSRDQPPRLITVTVAQRLRQLRARCSRRTLVDGDGREIRFYRLHCFGAPTAYALETMRRERAELGALRRRYTVITLTCGPSGEPTP